MQLFVNASLLSQATLLILRLFVPSGINAFYLGGITHHSMVPNTKGDETLRVSFLSEDL
jgi:hypothetical protein